MPRNPDEWQEAVDLAEALLAVDSAEQYGLVTGPKVNTERCELILRSGAQLGYRPHADAIDHFIRAQKAGA
jgi:hypothetical protein